MGHPRIRRDADIIDVEPVIDATGAQIYQVPDPELTCQGFLSPAAATSDEVVVRPGGRLGVRDPGEPTTRPLTVLPHEVMAADRPYITSGDLAVLQRLDPSNIEGWTAVRMTDLDGWQFSMQSHPAGPVFVFVAMRSPYESNAWRLTLLEPKTDKTVSHLSHIITVQIDANTTVPVLCLAPGARPAVDLPELRAQAAKWCLYTTRHWLGQDTIFSK
ncbi:hypothetical protein [Acidipropionibacterium acidipropionici]|uniref:hypothetical protein n=1 Tax=Acidipropionibacterium acidipropionici TaxID=1748 RepID=UPI00110B3FF7|nr:hypothetical protein [Acidipropionibacterium acidipropionici]QCV96505.1 hypothetical protein FEZ30_15725 [Acidipropionibacterium acidipropionici]